MTAPIQKTMEAVVKDMEASMPALLRASGLGGFDRCGAGYPYRADGKELRARFAALADDGFDFVVHAALPKTPETEAYAYFDAIAGWIGGLDCARLGFDVLSLSIEAGDDFESGAIEGFFSVTLRRFPDGCD
jgi:hypothetical protein